MSASDPEKPVSAVRRGLGHLASIVVATTAGAVLTALVDWVAGGIRNELQWSWSTMVPASAVVVGLTAPVGAIVGLFLGLFVYPLTNASAHASSDGRHLAMRAHRRLFDEDGTAWSTAVGLPAAGAVVLVTLDSLRDVLALQGSADIAGAVAAKVVAMTGCVVLYIAISRRAARHRTRTAWLAICVAGVIYSIVLSEGTYAVPLHLVAGLPPLFGAVGWVLAILRERSRAVLLATNVIAIASFLVFAACVVVHRVDSAAHDDAMRRGILAFPAFQVVEWLADLDGDGTTGLMAGPDCDDLDPLVGPRRFEIVANSIDDNCGVGDLPSDDSVVSNVRWARGGSVAPDVIIISIDTLRADVVGSSVKGLPVTPALDALARNSVVFTHAYSPSTGTEESIPATMAGVLPHRWQQFDVHYGIEPTLAEILGQLGYQTAAVTALPHLQKVVVHGFDVVDNRAGFAAADANSELLFDFEVTDAALRAVDKREPGKPLLLWVHFFAPHAPYREYPQHTDWLGEEFYLHEVNLSDTALGRLMNGLSERGMLDTTVLALFSDHGESLGEHGVETHAWTAYDEVVRVPFMMRLPEIPPAEVDVPVTTMDLLPTLLDVLGVQDPVSRDGRSLLPLVRGEGQGAPVFIESNYGGGPLLRAVVDGKWKLIHDRRRHSRQLYDLERDPGERRNLLEGEPEVAARLWRLLQDKWERGYNSAILDRKKSVWPTRGVLLPKRIEGLGFDPSADPVLVETVSE